MNVEECVLQPCCATSNERDFAGVGALIVSPDHNFLSIEELTNSVRTVKLEGMRSFPMESIEFGEKPCETLERLFVEEIQTPQRGSLRLLSNSCVIQIRPGLWVTVYLYEAKRKIPITIGSAAEEVANPRWISIDAVLRSPLGNLNFRPGVRETLLDYSRYGWVPGPRFYENCVDTTKVQSVLHDGNVS